MDREKVSELIHNAESQAARMAENGATIIFNIQIAGGWKIEKTREDTMRVVRKLR